MTPARNRRVNSINQIIDSIPTRNLGEIERMLKQYLIALEAKRLDASVKPNNITMEEIVEEIKKMRRGE